MVLSMLANEKSPLWERALSVNATTAGVDPLLICNLSINNGAL